MLGVAAEVAAREAQHALARRARERGEQRALIVGDAIARAAAARPPSALAIGVGEQRIVAGRRGEHAFGQPAHPHPVELDAERERRRPDEHTLAQPADAIARRVELERERSAEHLERRARLDRVEPAEPVDRGVDPARRLLLERRPIRARRLRRRSSARSSPCAHRASADHVRGRAREVGGELRDEPLRACAPARARRSVPARRVVVAGSASAGRVVLEAARSTPRRRRPRPRRARSAPTATAGTSRPWPSSTGTPASNANTSSRRKSWSGSASRRSRPRPSTESASVRTDTPLCAMPASSRWSCSKRAYGSVLPSTTAMRSSGTPSRIASTMPRTTTRTSSSASEIEHTAVPCAGVIGAPSGIERAAEPLDARDHLGVGLRDAGEPGDHDELVALGQRAQQPRDRGRDALRQVAHDRAELGDERRALVDDLARGAHEIVLVVPAARELLLHEPMDPHDLARPRALLARAASSAASSRSESSRCAPTSASSVAGCVGDRREQPARIGREHAPDRGRDHRGRDRAGDRRPRAAARRAARRAGTR